MYYEVAPQMLYSAAYRSLGVLHSGSRENTSGQAKVVKCYNCQGEGHMARQSFQTDDLDAYDSDCDDISSAKEVFMANLSSCDSDILSDVPYSNTFQNDMMNQSVQEL
ncbi:integrase, catalytic region, zinc finger, CCHC-type containing protein [Tanacetum coccineum]